MTVPRQLAVGGMGRGHQAEHQRGDGREHDEQAAGMVAEYRVVVDLDVVVIVAFPSRVEAP